MKRCAWASSELLARYHDEEWGRPAHDDAMLFELLTLEGAQAGLSWEIVLRKRDRYRELFHGFDPARVARMRPASIERMLNDPGIVRHRGKLESVVSNARAVLAVQRDFGSFDRFIWALSDAQAMSKELRRRGFRFVGPTICYAFMQAAGMVNDHLPGCAWAKR